ncbi:MAG TPA: SpoIIE family protein phosphatase, partial [Bryobacteraceae bacterium]
FSQRYDQPGTIDNIEFGKGLTGAAAEARKVIRVADVTQDPRYIASHPDIRSEVAAPLILQDRVIGVLDLESTRYGFFTDEHIRALTLLTPQIATSVENARLYEVLAQREQRMEQDLKAAYKLQSVLLPRAISDIAGLHVGVRTRPAREISGDLYDFFEQKGEYSLIAFGDVSGKGAAAALYGALISGLLRILAPGRRSPAQLMKMLNEALLERKIDAQYATLSLLSWDAPNHTFTIANAGGIPPMICRRGEILSTRIEGVPIGLLDDQDYDQTKIVVQPDDLLLLYSDGVEDQLSADEEEYGRERLRNLMRATYQLAPQKITQTIFGALDDFRGATPLTDDQTVIALKVL